MDIEARVEAVGFADDGNTPTVLLREAEGDRYLPLVIGRPELFAIVQALEAIESERPTTHDLLAALLDSSEIEPICVRIDDWRDGIFRAAVVGTQSGAAWELDARPSDAVALALRLELPIRVAPNLFRRYGLVEREAPTRSIRLSAQDREALGEFIM